MIVIQLVLLLFLGAIMLYFLQNRSTAKLRAGKKVLFVLFSLLTAVAILSPDTLNVLAHLVGVGRGADLVLYLLTVSFIFASLNTYMSFKDRDQKIVSLSRKIAIYQAEREYPWSRD
jgi:small membrane protein